MGIFFSYDENGSIVFNELEAVQPGQQQTNDTSTTDYTQEEDDEQNPNPEETGGRDNPQEAPEDYTISDNGGEDQTPEEADANPPEEGTEATGGEPEGGGGTDYTDDGAGGGDPSGGGDPGAGGGGVPNDGQTDDDMGAGGDDTGDSDMGDDTPQSEDDIKALEDEIYSNYSDEQRQIMSKELKGSMNKLVTLSSDLVERINDIPKVSEHIRDIEFISNKLSDFRDMLTDYLYYTYDTESYVKNQIAYKRFMAIMKQMDTFIQNIQKVDAIKNKNKKSQD